MRQIDGGGWLFGQTLTVHTLLWKKNKNSSGRLMGGVGWVRPSRTHPFSRPVCLHCLLCSSQKQIGWEAIDSFTMSIDRRTYKLSKIAKHRICVLQKPESWDRQDIQMICLYLSQALFLHFLMDYLRASFSFISGLFQTNNTNFTTN